jgi:hypothetical protein
MTATNALFMAFKARAISSSTSLITGPTWGTTALGDLDSETLVNCVLTDNGVIDISEVTHQDVADVTTAFVPTPVVMTGTAITNPSSATVRWDANDVTFTSVSGATCEQVVTYFETAGATSTDILICKFGVQSNGLPVTPNGGNIVVQWNASGIFEW